MKPAIQGRGERPGTQSSSRSPERKRSKRSNE
jgi:hypothetical protein